MIRAILVGRTDGNIGDHQQAVMAGLARHGVQVRLAPRYERGADFVICWGWRRGKPLRESGARVLVMERGYIGPRLHWTSLGWNGLNGRADFCLPNGPLPERFSQHFTLKPWRIGGDRILVMGQVPGDMSLDGRNLKAWYDDSCALARERYGLPTIFRPHPGAIKKGLHANGAASGPLEAELEKTALAICWNSNSAVDAVLAGVPVVVIDQGAMAWLVAAHRIGGLVRPAREEWANRVSWCQWSPEELAAGAWWERMRAGLASENNAALG